jgi:hypothetical protein
MPQPFLSGNDYDPATPLGWTRGLAGPWDGRHLVRFGGGGHGIATSDPCIDAVSLAYLLDLRLPAGAELARIALWQREGRESSAGKRTAPIL